MTLPLFLTLSRLIVSPILIPTLLIKYLPLGDVWTNKILALIITCFCLTDFLDGYLARRWKQTSSLGEVLDPLGDKVLVLSVLATLSFLERLPIIFVAGLFVREVWVSVERYYYDVPVSTWGKYKSFSQYILIVFIVGSPWFGTPIDDLLKALIVLVVGILTIASWGLYNKKRSQQRCEKNTKI